MPSPSHFVQVGDAPVFQGDGPDTLSCTCRQSVLVSGYRPGSLLAVGIQCFRCGEVTLTRGVRPGEVLPQRVRSVPPTAAPVPTTLTLPAGLVLVGEAEVARADALARPADPPAEPLTLDEAAIGELAASYDRVSGGKLEAHRTAVLQRAAPEAWLPDYPLAWALTYLRARVARPGWTWFAGDADSTATAHLLAFREFLACWSRHPLFPAMTATAVAAGFSLHALAGFAAATAMARSGNRVSHIPPAATGRMEGFAFGPPGEDQLSAVVQPGSRFDWPNRLAADPAAIRAAVLGAMQAAQGRIHLKRPGVLILSFGTVPPDFDQKLVDGMQAVLRAQGRRHRGITALAAVLPKVFATRRADQVGFGWSFYPVANPHPAANVAVRVGAKGDFAGLESPRRPAAQRG